MGGQQAGSVHILVLALDSRGTFFVHTRSACARWQGFHEHQSTIRYLKEWLDPRM